MFSDLPLADVRVLAFTQLGAGPFGLMFLSDLGADVIKVEDPTTGGDEARVVPPYNDPAAHDGLYYQSLNRGARSITLNLRRPEARDLLHRLVGRVDAVYNNMRGDLPAKLGLDYAALAAANPGSSAARSPASAARAHASAIPGTTTSSRRTPDS
jgi:crotonobetainyl-CoA:carnitine CoA-transferase CaiB-like acyl-CoA transferase